MRTSVNIWLLYSEYMLKGRVCYGCCRLVNRGLCIQLRFTSNRTLLRYFPAEIQAATRRYGHLGMSLMAPFYSIEKHFSCAAIADEKCSTVSIWVAMNLLFLNHLHTGLLITNSFA